MAAPVFDPSQPYQVVKSAAPQKAPGPQFDPDQPFEVAGAPGKLESLLRGIKQSATLNFGDELTGGVESALGSLGVVPDKTYDQAVGEARANDAAAEHANPLTFGAGELAGGLGTALIPGLGAVKGLSTMGKVAHAAKLGAGLGAISGVGASEDKDIGDAAKGALLGGLGGGIVQSVGSLASKGAATVGRALSSSVHPETQLGLALGATAKELDPSTLAGKAFQRAVNVVESDGIFTPNESGLPLNKNDIAERVAAKLKEKGAAIGDRVAQYGDKAMDPEAFQRLFDQVSGRMDEIVANTAPNARAGASSALDSALSDLLATDGKLASLWKLKSNSGGWAGKGWTASGQAPPVSEGFMALNRELDTFLTGQTDAMVRGTDDAALGALNQSYKALKTIEPVVGRAQGREAGAASSLGLSGADARAGAIAGGTAAGMGLPGAGVVGMVGAAANNALRSTEGRIMRANIGRTLEQQAAKQSEALGAIPRVTTQAQAWLKQHFQMLPPQMQQTAAAIVGAPTDRAEQMLRAVIPTFAQHFAKSSYPSELDGAVSSEDDKAAIRKRLQAMQLPSTTMALRLSALNHKGTIPLEAYDPQSYGDSLQDLMTKMMGPQGQQGGMQ